MSPLTAGATPCEQSSRFRPETQSQWEYPAGSHPEMGPGDFKSFDFNEELAKASRLLSQVQGKVLEAEWHVRAIGDEAIEAEW